MPLSLYDPESSIEPKQECSNATYQNLIRVLYSLTPPAVPVKLPSNDIFDTDFEVPPIEDNGLNEFSPGRPLNEFDAD